MHVAKGLFGLKLIMQFMGYTKILCLHVTHLIKILRKMKRTATNTASKNIRL